MDRHSLRIVVITQDDPFYLPLFFRSLLKEVGDDVDIQSIVCLDPFDESFFELIGRMYRLYGPVLFLRRGIEFVVRKGLDASGLQSYSVESTAERHGIPVRSVSSVNTEAFVRRVQEEEIDVILSVAAPEILKPEVLEAPRWGCLNVHTAKLPQYRGMLPTFWALYHGDEEIGVTVHTMEKEIDRGKIAGQTTFPVRDADTLDDVIKRGKEVGGRLAADVLENLRDEDLELKSMEGEESYFSFPTVEERRELQERGRKLI